MSLADTFVDNYNPSKVAGKAIIKRWRKNKKQAIALSSLRKGHIIFTTYLAVTPGVYDYNPVVMVLRENKFHVLGLNLNWLTPRDKRLMLNFLIKKDFHNKTPIQRRAIVTDIRRRKYIKKAYRLYHRKELAKPRLYDLEAHEVYEALTHDLRWERKKKK